MWCWYQWKWLSYFRFGPKQCDWKTRTLYKRGGCLNSGVIRRGYNLILFTNSILSEKERVQYFMVNVTMTMLRAWSKSSSGVPANIDHSLPKQVVCYTVFFFCVVTKRPSPLAWWHKKRLCSRLQNKGQVTCRLYHGETHWNQGHECKCAHTN